MAQWVKNPPEKQEMHTDGEFDLWVRKIPWRRAWQPTSVFSPGDSMDRRAWWATAHSITELDTAEATNRTQARSWVSGPPPAPSFQPKTWAECGPLISVNITDPTLHYYLRCLNVVSSSRSCCFTFLSVMFSCLFAWRLLEYLMVKQLCREFIIFFP